MNLFRWLSSEMNLCRAFRAALGTPDGQTVLRDLMRRFHMLRPTDPEDRAFAEGQRSVVLYMLTRLRMSDADIERMFSQQPVLDGDLDAQAD